MGFLEPFSRQRKSIGNLNDIDVEDEETETQESTTETQENTTETEKNTDLVNNDSPEVVSTHKRPNLKQLPKAKKDESASMVLMKYLSLIHI